LGGKDTQRHFIRHVMQSPRFRHFRLVDHFDFLSKEKSGNLDRGIGIYGNLDCSHRTLYRVAAGKPAKTRGVSSSWSSCLHTRSRNKVLSFQTRTVTLHIPHMKTKEKIGYQNSFTIARSDFGEKLSKKMSKSQRSGTQSFPTAIIMEDVEECWAIGYYRVVEGFLGRITFHRVNVYRFHRRHFHFFTWQCQQVLRMWLKCSSSRAIDVWMSIYVMRNEEQHNTNRKNLLGEGGQTPLASLGEEDPMRIPINGRSQTSCYDENQILPNADNQGYPPRLSTTVVPGRSKDIRFYCRIPILDSKSDEEWLM